VRLEGSLIEGTFIRRDNRFRATVEVRGQPVWAHVPNSGRLEELFVPGRPVLLRKIDLPHRKTKYDLTLVELDQGLVSVDARLPNKLVHEAIAANQLPEFTGYQAVHREVAYGASRLDFMLEGGKRRCFVEVKSVTLVCAGVALFPDAPTLRGRRHVGELAQAILEGKRAAVVFVVQREDAVSFAPNDAADPAFGQTLREAARTGLEVYAYLCRVSWDKVALDRPIPVTLQPISVSNPGPGRKYQKLPK
jgi:sugar fermentation stimulation protein A